MEKKYLSRDVIGKQVIDPKAIIVGKVKDLSFDMTSKNITLIVTTTTGADTTIDGNHIAIVGDVVLLSKPIEAPTPAPAESPVLQKPQPAPQPPAAPGLCSACGYQNDTTAKFCIKCGSKLK